MKTTYDLKRFLIILKRSITKALKKSKLYKLEIKIDRNEDTSHTTNHNMSWGSDSNTPIYKYK